MPDTVKKCIICGVTSENATIKLLPETREYFCIKHFLEQARTRTPKPKPVISKKERNVI